MRTNKKNAAHFLLLILITACILLFLNLVVLAFLFLKWKDDTPIHPEMVTDYLTVTDGKYALAEDGELLLEQQNLFAMILGEDGSILWENRLPKELNRDYTMQDVARFTRYYLEDYPVNTYVVDDGLLVIGREKHTTWKYSLEYSEPMLLRTVKLLPVLLLVNLTVLIAVPLFIQRTWIRRREEERTEWIAGVSHDIRTPLTLILGNSNFLLQNTTDAEVLSRAKAIETQGLKIRSLVTNLNTSSKLSFGMGDYKKEPVELKSFLRKTIVDHMNSQGDDRYVITPELDEELISATVSANPELLQRMLDNLIHNAMVHNPEGCNIQIALKQEKPHRLSLTVSDDGVGASQEIIWALNRKRYTNTDKLGEHGIGLRLVKQIAAFHGWKVAFTTGLPQGFVCCISIKA